MNAAIATLESRSAERTQPVVTSEELELVRKTVANGATDAELRLYLFDCQRRGVHPLDRLLHFTKRGGRYTPVTSIDFMRSQAAMSGEMAGSDDPIFHPKPTGADPEKFLPPSAATVTVYRLTQGQRFAYSATARWAEYCSDNAPMWKRMPHTMLGKCAEALALRKAFPQQLAGLYSAEEMEQAEGKVAPSPPPTIEAGPTVVVNTITGEETTVTKRPNAPEGYEAWAACLPAKADEGFPELTRVFNAASPAFRNYLTKQDKETWLALKATAEKAAAS